LSRIVGNKLVLFLFLIELYGKISISENNKENLINFSHLVRALKRNDKKYKKDKAEDRMYINMEPDREAYYGPDIIGRSI